MWYNLQNEEDRKTPLTAIKSVRFELATNYSKSFSIYLIETANFRTLGKALYFYLCTNCKGKHVKRQLLDDNSLIHYKCIPST